MNASESSDGRTSNRNTVEDQFFQKQLHDNHHHHHRIKVMLVTFFYTPDCTKLLGTKASSRTNGYLYKCIRTVWKPYLEIHLNRPYKIIAIATKQGEKWVKPYKIGFQAGSRFRAVYSDAGTRKVRNNYYKIL